MKTISSFCRNIAFQLIREEINDDRIQVYDMSTFGSWEIKLGVNWSAIGTVSAEEAAEFAAKLTKAAEIAANHPMNGCKTVYSHQD